MQEEKGQILYIAGRDNQIATSPRQHDIAHDSYGINADLIKATNQ